MRKQSNTSTITLRDHTWESIHPSIWRPKGERMKTKFDIAHDLLAVLGTIKDLELEVRKLKREVEQECWQFKEKQKAENKAL